MKFVNAGVPAKVWGELHRLAKRFRPALPGWCERVVLQYDHNYGNAAETDAIAEIAVKHEYRSATLTIFGHRWVDELSDRQRVVAHEFSHLITAPLAAFAHNLLDSLAEQSSTQPDPAIEALREQLRVVEEMTVEDTGNALVRMYEQGKRA